MAMMVPNGMDLWASLKSPDLFEPAIMPEKQTNKTKIERGRSNNLLFDEEYQQWENEIALFAAPLHSRNRQGHVTTFQGGR